MRSGGVRPGYDNDRKRAERKVRLTPHQKEVLGTLESLSRPAKPVGYPSLDPDPVVRFRWLERYEALNGKPERRWVLAKYCGGPAALEHLVRKGYAEVKVEYGPRGGERRFYRVKGRA